MTSGSPLMLMVELVTSQVKLSTNVYKPEHMLLLQLTFYYVYVRDICIFLDT